jgi:hypothetical protein
MVVKNNTAIANLDSIVRKEVGLVQIGIYIYA